MNFFYSNVKKLFPIPEWHYMSKDNLKKKRSFLPFLSRFDREFIFNKNLKTKKNCVDDAVELQKLKKKCQNDKISKCPIIHHHLPTALDRRKMTFPKENMRDAAG